MKPNQAYLITIPVALLIGMVLGIVVEKKYGVKNLFEVFGISSGERSASLSADKPPETIPEAYQGKLQLFILAGQSNMAGVGKLPSTGLKRNPQIFVFGNDYRWKVAVEPVDSPENQVDSVSEDQDAGFGPSVAFATTLLETRSAQGIGLIPCAKGGSSIYEWRRNLSDRTLYGSCLKRVRAASNMGRVAGLLFFQGEIDAIDPQEQPQRRFLPHQWAGEFTGLVQGWRQDLGLPKLPVVFAQLGTNRQPDRFKNWAVVKEQQRQVRIPFSTMITTDDLAIADYVHFTNESYEVIGQRFAEAYLNLTEE